MVEREVPGVPTENVIGIGVDVERSARFGPERHRLFTRAEIEHCIAQAEPENSFAGTWCAKEAALKALSACGLISVRDVEILRDESGAPSVSILRPVLFSGLEPALNVSIAHSDGLAVAMVIAYVRP